MQGRFLKDGTEGRLLKGAVEGQWPGVLKEGGSLAKGYLSGLPRKEGSEGWQLEQLGTEF